MPAERPPCIVRSFSFASGVTCRYAPLPASAHAETGRRTGLPERETRFRITPHAPRSSEPPPGDTDDRSCRIESVETRSQSQSREATPPGSVPGTPPGDRDRSRHRDLREIHDGREVVRSSARRPLGCAHARATPSRFAATSWRITHRPVDTVAMWRVFQQHYQKLSTALGRS